MICMYGTYGTCTTVLWCINTLHLGVSYMLRRNFQAKTIKDYMIFIFLLQNHDYMTTWGSYTGIRT